MSRKTGVVEEPRVALAKAIDNLAQKEDAFIKASEKLETFSSQVMKDLDIRLDAKKEELGKIETQLELAKDQLQVRLKQKEENLMAKLEQQEEQTLISLENKIAKRKQSAINEFMAESGQAPYKKNKIEKMKQQVETLSTQLDVSVSKARDEEREKAEEHLKAKQLQVELETKATNAKFTAQYEQKDKEISMLDGTIINLREELKNQRELTKSVAQASRFVVSSETK